MTKYPRIPDRGGKPSKKREAIEATRRAVDPNYGKPCIVCGNGTARRIEVEVNWFRGEDEEIRVCYVCCRTPTDELLKLFKSTAPSERTEGE